MPKVLFTYPLSEAERLEATDKLQSLGCTCVVPTAFTANDLEEASTDAEIIIGHVTLPMLKGAKNLRLLQTVGHGIDFLADPHIHQLLHEKHILVARADPAAEPIAEYCIATMVFLSRRVMQLHMAMVLQGDWSLEKRRGRMQGLLGGELYDKNLLVLGLGPIGQAVVQRAKSFDMHIAAVTRHGSLERAESLGIERCVGQSELKLLLPWADYITICLPLTPWTKGMIGEQEFAVMHQGTYLVNISRGDIVDQNALVNALSSGKLAGAGLDVWWSWGGYPSNHPIHTYNVIMTPHISGATLESGLRALRAALENVERFVSHETPHRLADIDLGY